MESLHEPISRHARRRPDATAVIDESRAMSYGELEALSNRMARILRARGLSADDRVCLLVPKSAVAIAAMLGVLKAGAVYVPLDGAGPVARTARIVQMCSPHWLLVHPEYAALAQDCARHARGPLSRRVLRLDDPELVTGDDASLSAIPTPSGLAYIMFTSGSTGVPKGVQIRRESVAHFSRWLVGHFGIGPGDRLSGHASFHFDLSVLDIYGALTAGAELHLVPAPAAALPGATASFIRERRLTQWTSVPSVLVGMQNRDVVRPGDFPDLRRVLTCGDVLPTTAVEYWMRRLPHVTFVNLYGPTEATVASSFHTLKAPPADLGEPIPIGRAIPGERLAIFRPDGRQANIGELGELGIAGVGLSPGYWREPERTAVVFRDLPSAGRLERWYLTGDRARVDESGVFHFRGRADRQVKSRGYRIELDEVTAAVNALPEVAEATVVAVPVGGAEGRRLHAVCVFRAEDGVDFARLRTSLSKYLPAYMVPSEWHRLEEMPRNTNGKIDHRAVEEIIRLSLAESKDSV